MDQRTIRGQSGSLRKLSLALVMILGIPGIVFCQNTIVKKYRYNDVIVTFNDDSLQSALLMNISNDSLLLMRDGIQNWYPYTKLNHIAVKSQASSATAVWAGFFSGIWLGNFLFYKSDSDEYDDPTALMTRDYPEGIGAIGINALFGVVGMAIGNIFSPANVTSRYSFSGDDQDKYQNWQYFRAEMQGHGRRLTNLWHLQIQTGSISHRVLSTYEKYIPDSPNDYYYRTASYFNVFRKLQLCYSLTDNIRFGAALIHQGEPSIRGSLNRYDYPYQYVTIKYDAVGYYGTVAYAIAPREKLTALELVVGAGVGSLKTNLEFLEGHQQVYLLSGSYTSITLYAELHIYLSDFFSLALTADFCNSPEETIPAIEELNINEEKVTFGNSSFGIGLGYHF